MPIRMGRGGVNRAFPAGLKRSGAAQQVRRGRLLRGTDSEPHKTDFEPGGFLLRLIGETGGAARRRSAGTSESGTSYARIAC